MDVVELSETNLGEPHRFEFLKERALINIVPANKEITFVQKKIINTIILTVQSANKNDADDNPTIKEESGQATYALSFNVLREAIGFDGSHNYEYIVQNMDALTTTRVTYDMEGKKGRKHAAAPLVSYVFVDEETKRVFFRLDSSIESMVLSPQIYQRLSIRMQNVFNTSWQLTLFEIAVQALGLTVKRTVSRTWQDWSRLFSGRPTPASRFGSFNRTMRYTVEQVNRLQSQVYVEICYEKGGSANTRGAKPVESLYFKVSVPKQQMFNLVEESPGSLMPLVKEICKFGMSEMEAQRGIQEYGADYINAQLSYVLCQKKVNNKLAYFKAAIKEDYARHATPEQPTARTNSSRQQAALPAPAPKEPVKAKPSAAPAPKEPVKTKPSAASLIKKGREDWFLIQRKRAIEDFDNLPVDEQDERWDGFMGWVEGANKFAWREASISGRTSQVVMTEFSGYLVRSAPGFSEPSDQEIFNHLIETGVITA